jgi:hypothetical protein
MLTILRPFDKPLDWLGASFFAEAAKDKTDGTATDIH